jgi:hypothetical protein
MQNSLNYRYCHFEIDSDLYYAMLSLIEIIFLIYIQITHFVIFKLHLQNIFKSFDIFKTFLLYLELNILYY